MERSELRILVVDDQKVVREMLKKTLMDLGVLEIHEANDGQLAVDLIEELGNEGKKIHVIFLDWNMPQLSGFEFLMQAENNKNLRDTYLIMVTAEREHQNIMKALNAGARDYVIKPFSTEQISRKLAKVTSELLD